MRKNMDTANNPYHLPNSEDGKECSEANKSPTLHPACWAIHEPPKAIDETTIPNRLPIMAPSIPSLVIARKKAGQEFIPGSSVDTCVGINKKEIATAIAKRTERGTLAAPREKAVATNPAIRMTTKILVSTR
jgi:hypothetical protein